MKTCRCCGVKKANRPRGLCWTCYYAEGSRELFLSTSKFAWRGVGTAGDALPSRPTSALPATASKVAVLAARAERGESLWHPDDAVPTDDTVTPRTMGGGNNGVRYRKRPGKLRIVVQML